MSFSAEYAIEALAQPTAASAASVLTGLSQGCHRNCTFTPSGSLT